MGTPVISPTLSGLTPDAAPRAHVDSRMTALRRQFLTMIPSAIGMYSTLTSFEAYQAKVEAAENASLVVVATGPAEDDAAKNLMMLRVLRAVRMVKLVRLVRASKIYERWQARVSLSFATLTVIKCVGGIFLVTHCARPSSRAAMHGTRACMRTRARLAAAT